MENTNNTISTLTINGTKYDISDNFSRGLLLAAKVEDIFIKNEKLYVKKTTDTEAIELGSVKGEQGVGISNVTIEDYILKVALSDGQIFDLGNIRGEPGPDGVGIESVYLQDGHLYVKKTDDSSATDLGYIKGEHGTTPVKGTDYWTAEDKESIKQELSADYTTKTEFSEHHHDNKYLTSLPEHNHNGTYSLSNHNHDNKYLTELPEHSHDNFIESPLYPGCFYRELDNGFKEWRNPPMVQGIEYLTTERYNGSPVWVKLVDLGSAPTCTDEDLTSGKKEEHTAIEFGSIIDQKTWLTHKQNNFVQPLPMFSNEGNYHGKAIIASNRKAISLVFVRSAGGYAAHAIVKFTRPNDIYTPKPEADSLEQAIVDRIDQAMLPVNTLRELPRSRHKDSDDCGPATISAGTTLTGILYSDVYEVEPKASAASNEKIARLVGTGTSLSTYYSALENPASVIYTAGDIASDISTTATYYGISCSGFVSYVLGFVFNNAKAKNRWIWNALLQECLARDDDDNVLEYTTENGYGVISIKNDTYLEDIKSIKRGDLMLQYYKDGKGKTHSHVKIIRDVVYDRNNDICGFYVAHAVGGNATQEPYVRIDFLTPEQLLAQVNEDHYEIVRLPTAETLPKVLKTTSVGTRYTTKVEPVKYSKSVYPDKGDGGKYPAKEVVYLYIPNTTAKVLTVLVPDTDKTNLTIKLADMPTHTINDVLVYELDMFNLQASYNESLQSELPIALPIGTYSIAVDTAPEDPCTIEMVTDSSSDGVGPLVEVAETYFNVAYDPDDSLVYYTTKGLFATETTVPKDAVADSFGNKYIGKKAIVCSQFAQACLEGITYENSRYLTNNKWNTRLEWAFIPDETNASDLYASGTWVNWQEKLSEEEYKMHKSTLLASAGYQAEYFNRCSNLYSFTGNYKDLSPGDLLFYYTPEYRNSDEYKLNPSQLSYGNIKHVAICLGADATSYIIMHASNPTIDETEYNYGPPRLLDKHPTGVYIERYTYSGYKFDFYAKSPIKSSYTSSIVKSVLVNKKETVSAGTAEVVYTMDLSKNDLGRGMYTLQFDNTGDTVDYITIEYGDEEDTKRLYDSKDCIKRAGCSSITFYAEDTLYSIHIKASRRNKDTDGTYNIRKANLYKGYRPIVNY